MCIMKADYLGGRRGMAVGRREGCGKCIKTTMMHMYKNAIIGTMKQMRRIITQLCLCLNSI